MPGLAVCEEAAQKGVAALQLTLDAPHLAQVDAQAPHASRPMATALTTALAMTSAAAAHS